MAIAIFLLLLPGLLGAQVIFSRRVYAEHGRTYQQIWSWNAADGRLKPLTNSPRDHSRPICSAGGNEIVFVSGDNSVWSLDRATGQEHELWIAPDALSVQLIGMANDGAPLIDKAWIIGRTIFSGLFKAGLRPFPFAGRDQDYSLSPDGRHLIGTKNRISYVTDTATGKMHVPLGECEDFAWSPDGKRIACGSGFVADVATARSRVPIDKCRELAWSGDGARIACASDDVSIIDIATQKEVDRIRLPELSEYHFPTKLKWSPDRKKLLLGVYGDDSLQTDYVLIDPATRSATHAGSGNDAVWLSGRDAIAYITTRDLAPLPPAGKHNVWTAQLAIFDLLTGKQTLLTSGLTNNDDPVVCER